jgi:protein-tyrosine phosphatase
MNVLIVCLGNICRSPIAEGILKDKLRNVSPSILIDSAGLISYHAGESPDHRAIEIASRYGIDISGIRARQITQDDFFRFHLMLAMDRSIYEDLKDMKQKLSKASIELFLEYAGYPPGSEVPDPYYGNMKQFDECFRLIQEASEKIIKRMLGSAGRNH